LRTLPPSPGKCALRKRSGLSGVAVTKAEGAAEPLVPMNDSLAFPLSGVRDNQPIAESLMISLRVVVCGAHTIAPFKCAREV